MAGTPIEDDDGIEVLIDDEGAIAPDPKAVKQDGGAPQTTGGEELVTADQVAQLARDLAEAKKDKVKALAEAQAARRGQTEAEERLGQESETRASAQESAITAEIARATEEGNRLTDAATKAFEEGKYAEGVKLTKDAAKAESRAELFEARKAELAEAAKRPEGGKQNNGRASSRTEQWIDRHPQFREGGQFYQKAMAAHFDALAQGIVPESDEYFEHIEEQVGAGTRVTNGSGNGSGNGHERVGASSPPDGHEGESEGSPSGGNGSSSAGKSNLAATAAPVTRRSPGASPRQTVIRLTSDEREMADAALPDVPEKDRYKKYVELQMQLKAQGRIQ